MNNIKLSIFTGVQDTDIIDLGLYNPSIEGILDLSSDTGGIAGGFIMWVEGQMANDASAMITIMLSDLENADKYKSFHVSDLIAAQNYLRELKIACDTYPACTVKIETL